VAFKLGKSSGPIIQGGKMKSKLFFNKEETSIPGTPVLRQNLEGGVLGEANNDGSIFIDNKVVPGSEEEKHILIHEMVHLTDMKTGKLAYDDNYIKWNGETYPRKDGSILYNEEWVPEGSKGFPWEKMPWE
tara:strand:+ start:415 stop:807 length:393 start_codon:yes stop_codon:yes gene_type:complete